MTIPFAMQGRTETGICLSLGWSQLKRMNKDKALKRGTQSRKTVCQKTDF